MHAAAPRIRSLITAERVPPTAGQHLVAHRHLVSARPLPSPRDCIPDRQLPRVPIVNFLDANRTRCPHYPPWAYGDRRGDYDRYAEEGKQLWFYQSCMSEGCAAARPASGCDRATAPCYTWPSYMIDAPGPVNRAMAWVSVAYNISGELYWGANAADKVYTAANHSSWDDQWLAGGNGDGSLTYPGRPEKIGGTEFVPIASLRLKLIRDAYEDRLLFDELEAVAGRQAVLDIVGRVVRRTYDFDLDPNAMLAARKMAGDALEAALAHRLSAAPCCTLKPGAPPAYRTTCEAQKTAAACLQLNLTCSSNRTCWPPPASGGYWCNKPYKLCERCTRYTNPPCTAAQLNTTLGACEKVCDPGPHPVGYQCHWAPSGFRCEKQSSGYPNMTACQKTCGTTTPPRH